jgi:hypothetical protein
MGGRRLVTLEDSTVIGAAEFPFSKPFRRRTAAPIIPPVTVVVTAGLTAIVGGSGSFLEEAYLGAGSVWQSDDGNTRTHFWVQSLAVLSCSLRSDRYRLAICGTRGSRGFGSVSSDESDRITLYNDRAGDQARFNN